MTTTAATFDTDCGTTCMQCGEALIAPEWSEYVSEQFVLNLWSCAKCGCRFETEAHVPAESNAVMMEAFFPSLLVA